MPDNRFVYLIIAIVIAHFLFAVSFLIYKILKAPKSENDSNKKEQNE